MSVQLNTITPVSTMVRLDGEPGILLHLVTVFSLAAEGNFSFPFKEKQKFLQHLVKLLAVKYKKKEFWLFLR